MKMLILGFIAVMGVSSAVHAGPVSGLESQGPGLLPRIGCPPGQVAAPIYNSAGVIIGWRCGPAGPGQ
jgi:hypothetical protein